VGGRKKKLLKYHRGHVTYFEILWITHLLSMKTKEIGFLEHATVTVTVSV
jgi:hypothetical protein